MIDGRANPSRSTSAPSAAHVTPQTPSSRFWNRPKPIRSTASWTVTALVVATVFLLSASELLPPLARGRSVELPVAHQPHRLLVSTQRLSGGDVIADQESQSEPGYCGCGLAEHWPPEGRQQVEGLFPGRGDRPGRRRSARPRFPRRGGLLARLRLSGRGGF